MYGGTATLFFASKLSQSRQHHGEELVVAVTVFIISLLNSDLIMYQPLTRAPSSPSNPSCPLAHLTLSGKGHSVTSTKLEHILLMIMYWLYCTHVE